MTEPNKVLKPPGEMIDVNGRNVHVQRSGTGSPTVLFESGILNDSLAFHKVQQAISEITSTISYDRAGLGYSDPSPNPRRIWAVFVDELSDLLDILSVSEPLVLVGWSAGAQFIRNFADRYPDRVAGLVLIDSNVNNLSDIFPDDISQIFEKSNHDRNEEFIRLSKLSREEILKEFKENPPWRNHHPETYSYYEDLASPENFKYYLQLLSFWFEEEKKGERVVRSLGDIPMNVVYAIDEENPPYSQDQIDIMNDIWRDCQKELAGLSTQHRLIEVVCGHDIANEKPEVVIDAIIDVINQVRYI
jgi:pimeloyl-ACP methyl ester carboxylesterase